MEARLAVNALESAVAQGWNRAKRTILAADGVNFLAALVPLAGLWAVLQTIVGVALIEALMTQAAPYLVALLAVVAALRLAVHWRRRRADMVDARV